MSIHNRTSIKKSIWRCLLQNGDNQAVPPLFSKSVLEWLVNYLSGSRHYVQIDDRKSSPTLSEFGIPQGSILGPMLFNRHVADLQGILPPAVRSSQYANDTTTYASCIASQISYPVESMNISLASLSDWSNDSNLALNSKRPRRC